MEEIVRFKDIKGSKNVLFLLLKALFTSDKSGQDVPKLGLKGSLGKIRKRKAQSFLKITGYDVKSKEVPSMYLHSLGHAYHLKLLTHKAFPYRLLGIVHISSCIKKYASINFGDTLDIEVYFGQIQKHPKGELVSLNQRLYRSGQLVFEEELLFLKQKKISTEQRFEKKSLVPFSSFPEVKTRKWVLKSSLGLRFALIGGDLNLIHLHPWLAKLLGFKRHIAHGVWTLSKALSFTEHKVSFPKQINCEFKLPVFLPSTVSFNCIEKPSEIQFEVKDKNNEKPHAIGSVKTIENLV